MTRRPSQSRGMTADDFQDRIVAWARRQPDVEALVLAGSRAVAGAADGYSDWDFHLITTAPARFAHTRWLGEIAPCWCAHAARTPRGVIKVSAVFEQGWEADFVPLAAWQMKLVYWAMRFPDKADLMPGRLRRGIRETRAFMLGTGHRLLVGSPAWERRFAALQQPWTDPGFTREEFAGHVGAFWQKSVWVCKKIARPEPRSAMHWLHGLVTEHVYALLAEEARLAGRVARPEARKAEQWLDARRQAQTAFETGADARTLARALLAAITLFEEVSQSVATTRGFARPDDAAVAAWLRTELGKLTG
ncbi:Streptomycin adenylyltransferase [Lacunisphaera limnophila]|uniref:Streptomycin adenylyltransferase n=1 Tax=Lacunisphaera limnophila TaxID=1838286 RepID=A0A1D8AVB5_9BACT|nr:aminoglycoside 6-adenylyltransferase [Lacunisphaera limnophila]AOS44844.1 Streptomycin adenylyltransferase [Lacunisphaera limnophila]